MTEEQLRQARERARLLSEQDDADLAKSLQLDEKAAREELHGPETLTIAVESYVEYLSRSGTAAERYLERKGLLEAVSSGGKRQRFDVSKLAPDRALLFLQILNELEANGPVNGDGDESR